MAQVLATALLGAVVAVVLLMLVFALLRGFLRMLGLVGNKVRAG